MYQRSAALGFQQITTALSAATNLTLPVGTEQAAATGCNLSGNLLTVGGTVTGAFAIGQIVKGTGIPANTYIVEPGSFAPNVATWWLSNSCSTETGETVTGYAPTGVNMAIIRCITQSVMWRDDGTAPTASVGMPMLPADLPFEYAGPLDQIQFIETTAGAVLNVSYYSLSGGS